MLYFVIMALFYYYFLYYFCTTNAPDIYAYWYFTKDHKTLQHILSRFLTETENSSNSTYTKDSPLVFEKLDFLLQFSGALFRAYWRVCQKALCISISFMLTVLYMEHVINNAVGALFQTYSFLNLWAVANCHCRLVAKRDRNFKCL